MKPKFFKFALPIGMGLMLSVITIMGLVSTTFTSCKKLETKHCTNTAYPLWCSSAKACCPGDKPYTDGHGSCYCTLAGCRATGYACEHCWEE